MKIPSRLFEPLVLISLTIFLSLVWCFWEIAEDVIEGDTHNIDTSILLMMRNPLDQNLPWGPSWLQEMVRDISSMGSTAFLTIATGLVAVFFIMTRRFKRAAYLVSSVISGAVISNLLKMGFDRPRPDLVPHGTIIHTASFPSAHSMMSAIVFLSIGALLAKSQSSRGLKISFMSAAVFLTLIVGISRIYLGVHWPSDVMAGWIAGTMWAMIFWILEYVVSKRTKSNSPA